MKRRILPARQGCTLLELNGERERERAGDTSMLCGHQHPLAEAPVSLTAWCVS